MAKRAWNRLRMFLNVQEKDGLVVHEGKKTPSSSTQSPFFLNFLSGNRFTKRMNRVSWFTQFHMVHPAVKDYRVILISIFTFSYCRLLPSEDRDGERVGCTFCDIPEKTDNNLNKIFVLQLGFNKKGSNSPIFVL